MESRVLYEISFAFKPEQILFVVIPAVWLFIVSQMRKKSEGGLKKFLTVLFRFGCFITLAFVAIGIPNQVMEYNSTVGAYRRGEYQTVEGYVENFHPMRGESQTVEGYAENFHPMPATGPDEESFTIRGVRFFYSDWVLSFGYHNARSLGGVITGDGQHLRIGYTEYGSLGNVIVYIEELPDDQAE